MTNMDATAGGFAFVCLVQLIHLVVIAQSRWLAIGKAIGGIVLVFAFGLIAMLFMPPSSFDRLGFTITYAAPLAAVMGAFSVPSRAKRVKQ